MKIFSCWWFSFVGKAIPADRVFKYTEVAGGEIKTYRRLLRIGPFSFVMLRYGPLDEPDKMSYARYMTRSEALKAAEVALSNANTWANKVTVNPETTEAYSSKSRAFARIAQGYTDLARELRA